MTARSRLFHYFTALAVLVLIAALPLFSATGKIKGKITDPAGNPLQDVILTLLDPAGGQTYTVKTDKKGNYILVGIAPSEYRLKLEKEGCQSLEGKVTITPGTESLYDAVMAPEVKTSAPPEWQEKSIRAHDLFVQQKYRDSLALYQEILARNPELAFIHFGAGNCHSKLQEYDEAIVSFREAARLKPDFYEAYVNFANACAKLKKFDEAIPVLENAIRSQPGNGGLFLSLGLLYLNTGEGAKAAVCLEKAAGLNPKNASVFHSLGIAYAQTGDYAKAIENYEKYITLIADAKEIDRVKGVIEQLKPLVKK